MSVRILLFILFLISMHALIFNHSLIRKVIALNILNSSIVILFITQGSLIGSAPPFVGEAAGEMVDPVVQALMLTAIVIGVCVTSFSLALVVHLYARYGTFDAAKIGKELRHDE